MQFELRQLQKTLGITTVLVTHDQEEALTMADQVAVMHEGSLQQLGRRTRFTTGRARASSPSSWARPTSSPHRAVEAADGLRDGAAGRRRRHCCRCRAERSPGARLEIAVRPEKVALSTARRARPQRARSDDHRPGVPRRIPRLPSHGRRDQRQPVFAYVAPQAMSDGLGHRRTRLPVLATAGRRGARRLEPSAAFHQRGRLRHVGDHLVHAALQLRLSKAKHVLRIAVERLGDRQHRQRRRSDAQDRADTSSTCA